MMNAYDLFECFEFFTYEKIFLKQLLQAEGKWVSIESHICYLKTKACINMESNNRQSKVNLPCIFYFGLESNPLKKYIPQQSHHCENTRFLGAMSSWGAIPPAFFFGKRRVHFDSGFENNQSR